MGTLRSPNNRAAASSVPSPPSTISRSAIAGISSRAFTLHEDGMHSAVSLSQKVFTPRSWSHVSSPGATLATSTRRGREIIPTVRTGAETGTATLLAIRLQSVSSIGNRCALANTAFYLSTWPANHAIRRERHAGRIPGCPPPLAGGWVALPAHACRTPPPPSAPVQSPVPAVSAPEQFRLCPPLRVPVRTVA